MDTYFPWKSVKKHISDKPRVTNNIKLLISKRPSAFIRHGKDCLVYKFWRNKVQCDIKLAKSLYYNGKINDLAQSNAKKWWQQIKSLTGQLAPNKQAWYHQFLNDGISDTADLASKINDFFVSITEHFDPLLPVKSSPNVIPNELFVSERVVLSDLSKLATNKAIGPDGICNRLLKEFAPEFVPIIKDIYNQSLREGFLPDSLKRSIIIPVPKISPPQDIKSDLRPITLTSCLAKVLEGFTHRRLLKQVNCDIDPRNMLGKVTQLHKHWSIYFIRYTRQLIQETAVLAYFLPTSQKGSI